MSTIKYPDAGTFYDGVQALIQRGLLFTADYASFTVTLTGGH